MQRLCYRAGRRVLIGAVLALVVGAHASWGQDDVLRIAYSADIATMDPANYRGRETQNVLRNIYDGLVTHNDSMEVVPQLAESWRQPDPLTYEFTLRRGVRFHNGEPLTSADVVFSFERLIREGAIAGKTSPRKSLLGPLREVRAIDARRVQFVFEEPWPVFIAMLPFQEIVSRSYVEKVGDVALESQANGTGPFKLAEWRKGEAIVLERFDDYYGGSPEVPPVGPAPVRELVFRIMPDSDRRVEALLDQEVDLLEKLPLAAIGRVAEASGTRVARSDGTLSFFISLDLTRPPFDRPSVRKAMSHAFDKGRIIDEVLMGAATPLDGLLSPDAFGFKPLPRLAFDAKLARRLLSEGGYPDGIDVAIDAEDAFEPVAEAIAEQLRQVGIRLEVRGGWQWRKLREAWLSGERKHAEMALFNWGNASLDPVGIMVPVLRSGGRGNLSGYSNPQVDLLLDAAGRESRRDVRVGLYHWAQDLVSQDYPLVFLWLSQELYGVSKRLGGWRPRPDGRLNMHDAYLLESAE